MNDAIFKFKRYEDSSLSYTGIERHADEEVGGWDTTIRKEEYERLFYNQQATMSDSSVIAAAPHQSAVEEAGVRKNPAGNAPSAPVVHPSAPEKPSVDLSAISRGVAVVHAKFGEGKITRVDTARRRLSVAFSVGEKVFVMPDAFVMGFLTIKRD